MANVLLVIRNLTERSGGAERVFCDLANGLHGLGHKVTCAYFDPKIGNLFYPISQNIERINLWVEVPARPSRLLRFLSTAWIQIKTAQMKLDWEISHGAFVRQLRHLFMARRPDVVISFLPSANTPVLIAASQTGTSVICTNHNVPEQDYSNPGRWDPSPWDRKLRLEALEHANQIHVLFESFSNFFPRHLQDRVITIPNYIPAGMSPLCTAREKIIVGVGRLAPVKNFGILIEAWSSLAIRFPDWRVEIYGVGPQASELLETIHQRGLDKSMFLMGHRSMMQEVYAGASIMCHPALFEGFGLAPAEALACGTPVVAFSDCAGVNEFVFDGINGIMVDRRQGASALARGLENLMENENTRRQLAERAPASVAMFSLDNFLRRWDAAIHAACSTRRSR
jgi:glycosyltransferase involved in cell wall biosynthesis